MNNKLKLFVFAVLLTGFAVFAEQANAQYGNCNRGYGVGYGAYNYGYSAPMGYGYSSYSSRYGGYPGYSSYYAPQLYTGSSLYVSPGYYSVSRVAVPVYPVYRPIVVPVPVAPRVMPAPGITFRVGF
jgi:hypothetical protein